ncbi:hypothetical protein [Neorhodopirellula pilleata]|uniref:Uncharacterized protein n=1 Tax=Neorhodopirellula pilleata TaxID=2714738 RepID=A0A5C5ZKT2_9BACT|nr:hypothetical protein [Neorhodopirellula pilleata]TWT88022.1 hypothetical protein Pla100_57530 [Neorhodopirellula pilleata]
MNIHSGHTDSSLPADSHSGYSFDRSPSGEDHEVDEFRLKPNVPRPTIHSGTDHIAAPASQDLLERREQSAETYNSTSGSYPNVRHYPTLESMQRLYKLFGYVTVAVVFPYLIFRLVYLLMTTEENLLVELGTFSEFAVPLILLSVAATATLFGAAEGIRLAMDIQDNTLRLANHHDRFRR